MIHLSPEDLATITHILGKFRYTFYAYGSRVKGTHKKFSDLDLCVMENIPDLDMFYLKDAFEESDLPFKIDIKRWEDMSKDFQAIIKEDLRTL